MSQQNELLELVHQKGYRITEDGRAISFTGRELKLHLNRWGYPRFGSKLMNKTPRGVMVHKLQAYQKFGKAMFEEGIVVRHLDGNPQNNSVDNIEIGTPSDNMMDMSPEARRKNASNPRYDHKSIIADRKEGMLYTEIMAKYGISSKGTVSFIVNKSMALI